MRTDPMERQIEEALLARDYKFSTEPQSPLDFQIGVGPDAIHIEVKQFHSDRIGEQMSRASNVIAIQGAVAVHWFAGLLRRGG